MKKGIQNSRFEFIAIVKPLAIPLRRDSHAGASRQCNIIIILFPLTPRTARSLRGTFRPIPKLPKRFYLGFRILLIAVCLGFGAGNLVVNKKAHSAYGKNGPSYFLARCSKLLRGTPCRNLGFAFRIFLVPRKSLHPEIHLPVLREPCSSRDQASHDDVLF